MVVICGFIARGLYLAVKHEGDMVKNMEFNEAMREIKEKKRGK